VFWALAGFSQHARGNASAEEHDRVQQEGSQENSGVKVDVVYMMLALPRQPCPCAIVVAGIMSQVSNRTRCTSWIPNRDRRIIYQQLMATAGCSDLERAQAWPAGRTAIFAERFCHKLPRATGPRPSSH